MEVKSQHMDTIYRLGKVEDILTEMDLSEVADDVVDIDGEGQIVISGWHVFVPKLDIRVHQGIVGYWDKEMQGYMPELLVTVVLEGKPEHQDYIHLGRGGMVATMTNWLQGRLAVDEIEQLRCKIVIPDDIFIAERQKERKICSIQSE